MSSSGGSPVPNQTYDLVSVLYHVLESAQTYGKYIQDAQQTGDQELIQCFKDVQSQDQQRHPRAAAPAEAACRASRRERQRTRRGFRLRRHRKEEVGHGLVPGSFSCTGHTTVGLTPAATSG